MKHFLITAFGEDKPGIVKAVAEILYKHGFNIEDSAMTRLNNEFAIMLIVQTDDITKEEDLKRELKALSDSLGLTITVKQIPVEQIQKEKKPKEIINLIVYGADKPGIVFNVANLLADRGINISDLRTEKAEDLYVMLIEAELPQNINLSDLEEQLQNLKEKLNVDISCKKIDTVEM
ncbi:MAG: ACT domain-containing protein [Aquificae bacterium]|nr:ACT domain-containing protein [Aquificota bacterium]